MELVPPMSIKKSLAEAEGDVQSAEEWNQWAKLGFRISLGVAIISSLSWEDDDLIDLIPGDFFFLAFVISIPTALGCLGVLWMNNTTMELAIKKRNKKKHLLKSTEREHARKENLRKRERTQFKEILELIEGNVDNLERAIRIMEKPPFPDGVFLTFEDEIKEAMFNAKTKLAGEYDNLLRHEEAIEIWEEVGRHDEAKRIREKIKEEGKVKVSQKVVHGDEVSKTEIKDSVVSKSNIGSGGDDKFTKLKELKEMLSEGLIDDDEFKQMKKEILGK